MNGVTLGLVLTGARLYLQLLDESSGASFLSGEMDVEGAVTRQHHQALTTHFCTWVTRRCSSFPSVGRRTCEWIACSWKLRCILPLKGHLMEAVKTLGIQKSTVLVSRSQCDGCIVHVVAHDLKWLLNALSIL